MVWTWPDALPLSIDGYDIQRLPVGEERIVGEYEDIDRVLIEYLSVRGEYAAPLGPLLMRTGGFAPIGDPSLYRPGGPAVVSEAEAELLGSRLRDLLAASAVRPSASPGDYAVFIQQLVRPVEEAAVAITAKLAVVMAMSQGKVVRVVSGSTPPITLGLRAPSIDTIVVYAMAPEQAQIWVWYRPDEVKLGGSDPVWDEAPYIVKGLTLPIAEADPALTTLATEYATARGRLVAGETLAQADFGSMAATMRAPVGRQTLGRNGERIVLVRADETQGYEELSLDAQISGLAVHPKLRRALGFGYRDHAGLVPGQGYRYRITGRFRAEDLTDAIYDVRRVPSSTVIPAACSIRDLGLRFRLPMPVVLDPAPSGTALHDASRRGIRIDTTGFDSSWLLPSLDGWSALIEFPTPVTNVVLEVAPGHSFEYAAAVPWGNVSSAAPLPPGPVVPLTFASPISQLRLLGTGTLFAVRIPSGHSGVVAVHAYTGPITYAAEPLPAAPSVFTIYNLQEPGSVLTGPVNESTPIPPRLPAGIRLNWLPPVTGGLAAWPPDLDAGPPLDALAYQIQHRHVTPPSTFGAWEPVMGGDNLTVGSRDDVAPAVSLDWGCDLDAVFPAIRPRSPDAGFALHLSDVFGEVDPVTGTVLRPEQPFGSYHQYEISSVDAVGRSSGSMTLSNIARLEKHVPPPLPVGPQPPPAVSDGKLDGQLGPRARAIVAGAAGLAPDDIALLGMHQNAVVLEWGWRQAERDLDPTTAEFRVYSTVPPDVINGVITSVGTASPNWRITMTTSLPLVANEMDGQWITSNGHSFQVVHNDAGSTPGMLLRMSAVRPSAQPAPGPVRFGRPLAPAHQSPASWDRRAAAYPLTTAENYRHVFYDVLDLRVAHPLDTLWVGVSAADAQSYVPDQRTTGALSGRPGNESAIVVCAVSARFQDQPVFSVPSPVGDVPEIVTDEPTGRSVLVSLDLAALLGAALPSGSPCVLERCPADNVLSGLAAVNGQVLLTHPDGVTRDVITFANPGDEATVLATLNSDRPQALANRYLMFIVGSCSDPAAFFARLGDDILAAGAVDERLAPKPARYLYLVRAADTLGHISDGFAILPAIVRVPSTAGATTPVKRSLAGTDTAVTLTVAVTGNDPDTTGVLLFASTWQPGAGPSDPPVQGEAELLRLPNRPDLYPNNGLRLLLSDGTVLAPAVVKNLADPDVRVEPDGTRVAALTVAAAKGSWASLWCYGLTRDGMPSFVCGPFGTAVRA